MLDWVMIWRRYVVAASNFVVASNMYEFFPFASSPLFNEKHVKNVNNQDGNISVQKEQLIPGVVFPFVISHLFTTLYIIRHSIFHPLLFLFTFARRWVSLYSNHPTHRRVNLPSPHHAGSGSIAVPLVPSPHRRRARTIAH